MTSLSGRIKLCILLAFSTMIALGVPNAVASPISVGAAVVDPPTVSSIGVYLPITGGDTNYNAEVRLSYRETGASAWLSALPLLRVRPETLGAEDPPDNFNLPRPGEQFAGTIFGLEPGSSYDIRLEIADPDGGDSQQTITATTRDRPLAAPQNERRIQVTTDAELATALDNAEPGDLILLAAGFYSGPLRLARSGRSLDPIIVRGERADAVVIDAGGDTFAIEIVGSHVYFENTTVRNAEWGIRASNTSGIVIRENVLTDIRKGIYAKSGTNRDFYICDNVLEGTGATWPDVSRTTWDLEGIVITGQGHTVCHNRLSGFGDSLGLSQDTDIPNVAIDFYGNDILWGGDDAIELDFSHRNVRAFNNRISNSGMGVSTQPVWGGPIYILRNVIINTAHSPYKLNNDPSGLLIFHNTSVRTVGGGNYLGSAWPQFGGIVANMQFANNISIGTSGPNVTSEFVLVDMDHNGWAPDAQFTFLDSWPSFSAFQQNTEYEENGRILSLPVFQEPVDLGADYTTIVVSPDVALNSNSNALDAGTMLPNINDGYTGSAPDMGALERGKVAPAYGPRTSIGKPTVRPAPPTELTTE